VSYSYLGKRLRWNLCSTARAHNLTTQPTSVLQRQLTDGETIKTGQSSELSTYRPSPEVKYGAVHFSKQLSDAVSDFATMDSRGVLGQVAASHPQTARSDALRLDKIVQPD